MTNTSVPALGQAEWAAWQSDLVNHRKLSRYLAEIESYPEAIAHAKAVFQHHVTQAMPLLRHWRQAFETSPKTPSRYLDLLERVVCNWIYQDSNYTFGKIAPYDEGRRSEGRDIPQYAHSMIGRERLAQLRWAMEDLLLRNVPGDFIETGAWRGGACILMRGVLAERGAKHRHVLVADSFQGLPAPDPRYPEDVLSDFDFHLRSELSVSLEQVQANFARYGLLDEQVIFVEGFFRDTLPTLKRRKFALLRLDGDLFSSTMDALDALYEQLSEGGIVIVDDYGSVIDCRRAIAEFRVKRAISSEIYAIDGDGVFWIKGSATG